MKHSNIKKNVINSQSLAFRENFNKRYQVNNFDNWILKNYLFKKKMAILDLGCGNGKQITQAYKILKNTGKIVGVDLSAKSIAKLKKFKKEKKINNIELINGSMDDIKSFFNNKKINGKFDLIHSTYAFYYSKNFIKIINFLKSKLNKNGRFVITFPGGMNSLKDHYLQNKKKKNLTLKYNPKILIKAFKNDFRKISLKKFTNKLVVTNYKDLIKFTQSSGFYSKANEPTFILNTKKKFLISNEYTLYKDSLMIVAKK